MNEVESVRAGTEKLWRLFCPLLLVTFTNGLFLLVEKLFLAQVSNQAIQVAVNVAYVCNISQGACLALVMMAQVAVGRWFGQEAHQKIGPGIWQYLWFSFLSPLLTVPVTLFLADFYFQDAPLKELARPYLHFMIGMNFLHPLGGALACFFSGRGETRLLLFTAIGSQALKIGVSYLLVFGKWGLPALGLLGGAWGTLIAHGGFCIFLFSVFINKKNRLRFDTSQWKFRWELFKECIYPGFLRALNRVITFSCWALTARLMVVRGDDYALALSLGGALFFLLPCLVDALSQAQITIISQYIGAKRYYALRTVTRSGYLVALIICLFTAFPFLAFPEYTFESLFPMLTIDPLFVRQLFFGVFCSFSWMIIGSISLSPILAFRDMNFSLFMGAFSWINNYLLMLFFLEIVHIPASQFWLTLSLAHASTALLYHLRANQLIKRFQRSFASVSPT